jgi:hypothetical protein
MEAWKCVEDSPAQAPGIAVAHVVDPTLDGSRDLLEGNLARGVGRQQPLEPPSVGDALAPLQPPMGGKDHEPQEGDALGDGPGVGSSLMDRQPQAGRPLSDGHPPRAHTTMEGVTWASTAAAGAPHRAQADTESFKQPA